MTKRYNEYVTVRLSEGLKKDFEEFCTGCGMTVSGAVNLLVRNTIKTKKIPFKISTASIAEVAGFYEGGSRQNTTMNVRVDKEIREEFKMICGEIGIQMGRLIKVFMVHCIKCGKLPF